MPEFENKGFYRGNRETKEKPAVDHRPPSETKPPQKKPAAENCGDIENEILKIQHSLRQAEDDYNRASQAGQKIETEIVEKTEQLTFLREAGKGNSPQAKALEAEIAQLRHQYESQSKSTETGKSAQALANEIRRLKLLLSDKEAEFQRCLGSQKQQP